MSYIEDLADKLAQDTIAAMRELGDEDLPREVAKVIGASSQTTEEAFLTAMRVRLAEMRARDFIEQRRAKGPVDASKVGQDIGGGLSEKTDPTAGGH